MMIFNKLVAATLPFLPKKMIWLFSKSYIAGSTTEDAVRVAHQLNREKNCVTFDILGEYLKDLSEVDQNTDAYIQLIERVNSEGIDGNFSLKPTSFGLLLDTEKAYTSIRKIVALAAKYNRFVRIDMEDSQSTSPEIALYQRLQTEFPKNVGLVVQAYLKRTYTDLIEMNKSNQSETPLNFRLCKGIYVEAPEISFKAYEEINVNYLKNLELMFKQKMYVGIATHDDSLIVKVLDLIEKLQVPKSQYEFQMLYGVTPKLRKSLVDRGEKMRVYIPYGDDWFGYSTRRLKENPKMAGHIIKAIFNKG